MNDYETPKGFGWFLAFLGFATMVICLNPFYLIPFVIGLFIGWLLFWGGE